MPKASVATGLAKKFDMISGRVCQSNAAKKDHLAI